jgi:ribosome assembly protein 1
MAERLRVLGAQLDRQPKGGAAVVGGRGATDAQQSHLPPVPIAQQSVEAGVAAGFQMAASAGPLCQDPLWGIAFELEVAINAPSFDFSEAAWAGLDFRESARGPISGQVLLACVSLTSTSTPHLAIWRKMECLTAFEHGVQVMAATAQACRSAVEAAGARLVEALYAVQVATATSGLDAAAGLIKARRGRIVATEAREGQDLFLIDAVAPVEACLSKRSLGGVVRDGQEGAGRGARGGADAGRGALSFADELRRETSGAASASLAFSHWERLHVRLVRLLERCSLRGHWPLPCQSCPRSDMQHGTRTTTLRRVSCLILPDSSKSRQSGSAGAGGPVLEASLGGGEGGAR